MININGLCLTSFFNIKFSPQQTHNRVRQRREKLCFAGSLCIRCLSLLFAPTVFNFEVVSKIPMQKKKRSSRCCKRSSDNHRRWLPFESTQQSAHYCIFFPLRAISTKDNISICLSLSVNMPYMVCYMLSSHRALCLSWQKGNIRRQTSPGSLKL